MVEKQFIPLGSADHCLTEVRGAGQRFLCFPFCTRRASETDILLFVKPSTLRAVELLTEANSEFYSTKTDSQLLTHGQLVFSPRIQMSHPEVDREVKRKRLKKPSSAMVCISFISILVHHQSEDESPVFVHV